MGYDVRWGDGGAALQGAAASGAGTLALETQKLSLQNLNVQQQLRQRQVEFNVGTAFRAREQQDQEQQLSQQYALHQQSIAAEQATHNATLQAGLLERAMTNQGDLQQLTQQQQFEYQKQGQNNLETQMADQMADLRKSRLDPEGQRLFGEYSSKLAELRSERSSLPPDVFNDIFGQLLSDFQGADLTSHVQKPPTAYDDLTPMEGQQIVEGQPLPPGSYMRTTGERNGVTTREPYIVFPPDGPPIVPVQGGGRKMQKQDGSWEYIKPETQAAQRPDPTTIKPADRINARKSAQAAILARMVAQQTTDENGAKSRLPEITDTMIRDEMEAMLPGSTSFQPNSGAMGPYSTEAQYGGAAGNEMPGATSGLPELPASRGDGVSGIQPIPNYDPSQPPQFDGGTYDPSQPAGFQQLLAPQSSAPPAPRKPAWYDDPVDKKWAYYAKYGDYVPSDNQAKFEEAFSRDRDAGGYDIKSLGAAYNAVAPGIFTDKTPIYKSLPEFTKDQAARLPNGIPYRDATTHEERYSGLKYKGKISESASRPRNLDEASSYENGQVFYFKGKRYIKDGPDSAEEF